MASTAVGVREWRRPGMEADARRQQILAASAAAAGINASGVVPAENQGGVTAQK